MLTHSWLYPGEGGPITFFWTFMLIAQSCPTFCNPMDYSLGRLLCPWDSPGKNTGVGSHYHLQGIFPIQGLNPGILHHRRILYHLCHWKSHKQYGTRKPYTGCRIFFCLDSQKRQSCSLSFLGCSCSCTWSPSLGTISLSWPLSLAPTSTHPCISSSPTYSL